MPKYKNISCFKWTMIYRLSGMDYKVVVLSTLYMTDFQIDANMTSGLSVTKEHTDRWTAFK